MPEGDILVWSGLNCCLWNFRQLDFWLGKVWWGSPSILGL